jgi:hypothetical protein
MAIRIKNVGAVVGRDTNGSAVFGDQGTVRVIYQNQEFVWGPNETKSFSDNGIGAALQAQDARLRVMTDADGLVGKANASVTFSRW